ncbi:PQQ-dependent sugar dehydrogenase [Caulobacter sp. 17J65-9]|uniref:PQQ-dependent sugar dehydrogenase n=1 Tax=Caulobacter sp. 17J65-9 TaxID=2709382 RepID=UPI0013CC4062|nr:PQQ-dependent sugar dehydrogenase [Caulobacter sp. 17J65-9]NEX92382.1 PQQ-dependent sugar dehydrogenase [Caulobacter sp. 17J65-9]
MSMRGRRPARPFVMTFAVLALLAACKDANGRHQAASLAGARPPAETRAPNGEGQTPAFPNQTRAPQPASTERFSIRTVVSGLSHPWALAFLPDGRLLVTERPGRLRIVSPAGEVSAPVAGLPKVDARDQGGLLDVELSPSFATDGLIYWSYAEPRPGGNGTAVARGRLVADGPEPRVENVQVIFRQQPTFDSTKHFGSRLVFAPDGTLFVTLGERSLPASRVKAQDLSTDFGKVVRINPDGSIPKDNPFVSQAGDRPEIWSYGHRNVQAAALDLKGRLWTVEHGPKGGDELNRPEAGKNYGWPVITYGIDYSGAPIGEGLTAKAGMEQPVYYWDPVIAPSGMTFYTGDAFPAWKGSILIGGLVQKGVVRLVLGPDDRVAAEERLPIGERVRDVRQGPDGAVWLVTDETDGKILKLSPAG